MTLGHTDKELLRAYHEQGDLAAREQLMAKDWPDFFPSRRDTYAWRVGVHRRDG